MLLQETVRGRHCVAAAGGGVLRRGCGADGMIIVWAPTTSPHASSYGSDLTPEDMQYEKEHWKPRTTFRCVL